MITVLQRAQIRVTYQHRFVCVYAVRVLGLVEPIGGIASVMSSTAQPGAS